MCCGWRGDIILRMPTLGSRLAEAFLRIYEGAPLSPIFDAFT
jgi:hypothetical protein